ncbi:hypothetical protein ThesuDRAFT_01401 [Thermaerobacter subterraneus DSM 13965]|uniref:FesM n=1 Tax=Thermaerobacter subterraneus DSM 13965 TaxID=867903 RepID=K6Q3J2_9FIRM|nr:hypothetical protein ThesuDRAFT_01401 [Thermaerobacter subterraneus DSM 13965]
MRGVLLQEPLPTKQGQGVDLTRLPWVGRFLRWRHARTALQIPLLLTAALVIFDGLTGPQLSPKNLAGVLPWVHWRGLVVLALLIAGNVFCMACPFMLTRRLARRFFPHGRTWPRWLRNKWLAAGLLLAFFWAYEAWDLWASPWLTAWLAVGYFVASFVIDAVFAGAPFCKYVCPIGQFNFVNAIHSPFEVAVRDPDVCAACRTKDCIKGRDGIPGCELGLFQQAKAGNLDCTFCLDCVHACPYSNVGVLARVPAAELWMDTRRAGIGRLSLRPDLAWLVLALTAAAFVNAFGMVSPVYALQEWLASTVGLGADGPAWGIIFVTGMLVVPVLVVGGAAGMTRWLTGTREPLLRVATRYTYALAPMGFGMWLAHYLFHFLSGALTIVPVTQSFVLDVTGKPLLGSPAWQLAALLPRPWLLPLEIVLLTAGFTLSLVTVYFIALDQWSDRRAAARAALPWVALLLILMTAGLWLLQQPMDMRGTMM